MSLTVWKWIHAGVVVFFRRLDSHRLGTRDRLHWHITLHITRDTALLFSTTCNASTSKDSYSQCRTLRSIFLCQDSGAYGVRVSTGLRLPDTYGCLSHPCVNDDATVTSALSGSPLRHL